MHTGLPNTPGPAVDAPVDRAGAEIAGVFFPSVQPKQVGQFTVYSEPEVGHLIQQQLEVFSDTNGNGIRDPQEEVEINYTLRIFVSKDASFLEKAFNKLAPSENDVCVFLEDNSGDRFSEDTSFISYGGSGMVVIGPAIRDEISTWFDRNEDSGYRVFKEVEEQFGFSLEYNRRQLKKLIERGRVKSSNQKFALSMFRFLNGFSILAAPVNTAIGTFITGTTTTIRSYVKFQDYHWDPEAKNPSDDSAKFSPVLLPVSFETLDELASEGENAAAGVIGILAKELGKLRSAQLRSFKKLGKSGPLKFSIPKYLRNFLKEVESWISDLMKWVATSVRQMVAAFASLGKRWINAINAFYCGLWNGLVESVLGIVDLVGYLFQGLGALGKAADDAATLVPAAMETMDELIQALEKVEFGSLLENLFGRFTEGVTSLNPYAFTQYISIEKVAYFFGQVLGFIVEIGVSIFYSGGVDGLRAAALKFSSLGKGLLETLEAALKKLLNGVGKTVEGMIHLMKKFTEVLQKAKGNLGTLLNWLFDEIAKLARLGSELVQKILQKLKLSKEEISALDDLGLTFTNAAENTYAACPIRLPSP